MDFPCRKLRANHKGSRPSKLLFLDVETRIKKVDNDILHRMRIATTAYVSMKRVSPWDNIDWSLWKKTYPLNRYIEKQAGDKECLWLIAHNIFFDLQCSDFFYYFTLWGWECEFIYDNHLTYILIIRKDRRTIKAISTTNYFDYSLDKLGTELNMPKKAIAFGNVSLTDLIDYNRQDVRIIVKAMREFISFIDKHDCGKFSMTRASQSFNAYRHRFMGETLYIHNEPEIKALERSAYYGGRTEAFRIGKIPGNGFVFLDVNSMYPFVMRNNLFPTKLVGYRKDIPLERFTELANLFCCIAEVDLETNDPAYAVRIGEKICFPTGRFRAFLCTGSLRKALKDRAINRVYRAAFYKPGNLFSEYVDYFYPIKTKAREDGDRITERFTKFFCNSLYGKFGQRRFLQQVLSDNTNSGYYRIKHYDLVTGVTGIEYKLFNKIFIQYGSEDTPSTFTAVAAHVTESARLLLWSIIVSIGVDRVLYCDTDSVVIPAAFLPSVNYPIDAHVLGSLSVDKECGTLEINSCKDYSIDHHRIVKGVPKRAKYLGNNTYEYYQFLSQVTHMREEKTRSYITRKIIKRVDPLYDKGIIGKNGIISPFVLNSF